MDVVDNDLFLNAFGSVEQVLNHLKYNIKTEARVSNIHGIGIFAIKDIVKGEDVFPIWENESGIYIIPNERLKEIPTEVLRLLDMYFINEECGYKVIRLFKGFNFIFHSYSFCNSAFPNKKNTNITNSRKAIKNIYKGDEILEWYTENIYLENSK